jgi:drug/metabolite transporter (DMT)-like permease
VGRVGGTRASFATYLIPVVALVLGVTIRDDRVSAIAVSGVACVIAGAILASRPDRGAPVAEAASPLPGAGA